MPKKLKPSSPLLQKVSRLLKVPVFIARMRKSINIPRLISLKKSRKMKKFTLLKHYNYGYIQEYQFSPSNSPLSPYYCHRKPIKKRRYEVLYSMLFIDKCLGMLKYEKDNRGHPLELKALPSIENTVACRELSETSELSGEDDDYSIDERAEKFIERFYEEIRMQRQESLLEFNPSMLDDV